METVWVTPQHCPHQGAAVFVPLHLLILVKGYPGLERRHSKVNIEETDKEIQGDMGEALLVCAMDVLSFLSILTFS